MTLYFYIQHHVVEEIWYLFCINDTAYGINCAVSVPVVPVLYTKILVSHKLQEE